MRKRSRRPESTAGTASSFNSKAPRTSKLKFESLDVSTSGIELLNVRTMPNGSVIAAVFVPDGKLKTFLKKVEDYADQQTKPRKEDGKSRPKNEDLVANIADIRVAALEALLDRHRRHAGPR